MDECCVGKRTRNAALLFVITACLVLSFRSDIAAQDQTANRILKRADPVTSLPSQNKRWALLIGVDKYQDSNISPLRGAANDANSLREVLIKYAGFPQDQVVVLSTSEPSERQPTRTNILKRLSNLSGLVPDDGLLLFSFAGHGIERSGQAFLIPSDATLTEDLGLLEDTAVSVTQIKKRIKDTTVKQVMIFLDACRSYPTGRSNSSNPLTPEFTRAFDFDINNREVSAFAILYATAVGHRAYEYTEKHQGYFSWAIAQALSGAAANGKGEVTLRALVKYLEDNVPKLVALDYGTKVVQKPFAEIEGFRADELILSLASATAVVTPTRPGQVGPQPETPRDADGSNGVVDAIAPTSASGKVLLSRSYVLHESLKADYATADNTFVAALVQALQRVNLNVTLEWTLDDTSRKEINLAVFEIKKGTKTPAQSTGFVVNVETMFSVGDLPPYGEMKISVANVTLRAIDLSTGEIAAVQTIEARGFGNEQSQARSNALKEAGQQIPEDFIKQVVTRAGASGARPKQTTQQSNNNSSIVRAKGFTFELNSCSLNVDEVLCQFTVTNNNAQEQTFQIHATSSRLFDESGTEYVAKVSTLGTRTGMRATNKLVPEVQTKAAVKFVEITTPLNRATLDLEVSSRGIGYFKVTFRNISIVK